MKPRTAMRVHFRTLHWGYMPLLSTGASDRYGADRGCSAVQLWCRASEGSRDWRTEADLNEAAGAAADRPFVDGSDRVVTGDSCDDTHGADARRARTP